MPPRAGRLTSDRVPTAAATAAIEAAYHLDEPLATTIPALHGRLAARRPRTVVPAGRLYGRGADWQASFPLSLQLGVLAMAVALIIGIGIGTVAAVRQNSLLDRIRHVTRDDRNLDSDFRCCAAPGVCCLRSSCTGCPQAGAGGSGCKPADASGHNACPAADRLHCEADAREHDRCARTRLHSNAARAQGLGTTTIIRVHALKPALLPVLSYLGPAVAAILTGSVVVEEVFGIPGLGQLFVRGALNRDYTLVLGIVIFYATLVIITC